MYIYIYIGSYNICMNLDAKDIKQKTKQKQKWKVNINIFTLAFSFSRKDACKEIKLIRSFFK